MPPPYGGSNQFLLALRNELRRRGLRVTDGRVPRRARSVLLHSYLSDLRRRPSGRVVHRVDELLAVCRELGVAVEPERKAAEEPA